MLKFFHFLIYLLTNL